MSNQVKSIVSVPNNVWVSVVGETLSVVNNPTFCSLVSKVKVKMNQYLDYWVINEEGKKKKNPNPTKNPYFEEGIINHSRKVQIVTGFDYENSVNGRLEKEGKEGDFESQENWFEVVSKGLVTDKSTHSKLYFRYQYLKTSTQDQEFLFQGNQIEKTLFESFMGKESTYDNQGLDNPLKFQVCDLNNIYRISIGGVTYEREVV